MVPKRKESCNDLRSLVIKHFQSGNSQREVETKTSLPRETVRDIINKYTRTKCIGSLFSRGRKRKTTITTDWTIQRILNKYRRISTKKLAADIKEQLDMSLSAQNVWNRVHEIGMFGRVARKKPYVNKVNRSKRFKVAKEMLQKLLDFWHTVIWSDEWKFELFSSKGKGIVWRTPTEIFGLQCIVPAVKHDGVRLQYEDVLHIEKSESCIFLIEQWTGFITARY